MTCEDLADRVDAYALGALDAEEVRAVEAHLAGCPRCAGEAADALRAAAALALTSPLERPRPELRERVLAAARRDLSTPAGAGRRWQVPVLAAAAAVLLLAALGLGAWSLSLRRDVERLEDENAALRAGLSPAAVAAALLVGEDAVTWPMEGVGEAAGARAVLAWDPEQGLCALEAAGLPPLPAGYVYQLWLIKDDGSAVSMGTFTVDAAGAGRLVSTLGGEFGRFVAAGVSQEPAGGSGQGRGPMVLRTSFRRPDGMSPSAGWP
ncbi:MAG TPA: anti-sigma factor [Dehalococcoidia bacterium]